MNFGLSLGDFVTVPTLAWQVYKSCKASSDDFKSIAADVAALHIVLKEVEENFRENAFDKQRQSQLATLTEPCRAVLTQLEALLEKYDNLGTNSQRTWDRLKWGFEDISRLKERLSTSTAMLAAFNTSLANSSQARVEKKLNQLLLEVRAGKREASIVSAQSIEPLSTSDKNAWRQLRRELEDVGVTTSLFLQHRAFIVSWFQRIQELGGFDEVVTYDTNEVIGVEAEADAADILRRKRDAESDYSATRASTKMITQFGEPIGTDQAAASIHDDSSHRSIKPQKVLFPRKLGKTPSDTWSSHDAQYSRTNERALFNSDVAFTPNDVVSPPRSPRLKRSLSSFHLRSIGPATPPLTPPRHFSTPEGFINSIIKKFKVGECNLHERDNHGSTLLHQACASTEQMEAIELLLRNGASIHVKDLRGRRPPDVAVNQGNIAALRRIFKYRKPLSDFWQSTILHESVQTGNVGMTRLLLDHGALVVVRDSRGLTPLHIAAMCGSVEMIHLLIEKGGADMDSPQIQENSILTGGGTALHIACFNMKVDVVGALLDHGASTLIEDDEKKQALHITARHSVSDDTTIMLMLLQHGAEVNSQDIGGRTPLTEAAIRGHFRMARLLIEHGASTTLQNHVGRTPLHEAVKKSHEMVVKTLIEAGADPTTKDVYQSSPMDEATKGLRDIMLRLFIAKSPYVPVRKDHPLASSIVMVDKM